MKVLVINCGSSSLKYQLIDSDTEAVLAKGLCERIGIDGRLVYQKTGLDKEVTEAAMPTHKEAIQMVLDALTNEKTGAIASLAEVNAIGHRVVHGGEKFAGSVVITDEVKAAIEECIDLAPLHNPANFIFFIVFIWKCIHICFFRHCLMESCIKYTYHWCVWHKFLTCSDTN